MADENFDEDIFDDLYDEEPASKPAAAPVAAPARAEPEQVPVEQVNTQIPDSAQNGGQDAVPTWQDSTARGGDSNMDHSGYNAGGNQSYDNNHMEEDNYGPINVKEDG
ncbi:uncharacterized protein K460DRAFT_206160 [Cucurbitaria berberidis CBS 394.84]|uniref:Uncharacterized protein n=1 Tax=Cucurbitaria berberidis CBS 394.84 TaxID=1168544 RepID=A0A9P4G7D8_9PLEO|nr:uncharacterized protein K460DRAFT_206160 [Cucurbitaria berberidis CBS 394.84]KAF1840297.1 hypothetical protein K460DRAFT_206160 [Cucurbitaria berberidis CBS 394.84]